MVRRMANAPDGRYSLDCTVLEPPRMEQPIYANDSAVRRALGNGRCVLLTGHTLEGPSLSKEDMLAFRGSLQHKLECIGEYSQYVVLVYFISGPQMPICE